MWSPGGPQSRTKSCSEKDTHQKVDKNQWVGGAARGNRTPDPIITNDVLYQLSYCGEWPLL